MCVQQVDTVNISVKKTTQPLWLSLVLNPLFVHASGQAQALKTNSVSRHYEFGCFLVDVSDAKTFTLQERGARSRRAFTVRLLTATTKDEQR